MARPNVLPYWPKAALISSSLGSIFFGGSGGGVGTVIAGGASTFGVAVMTAGGGGGGADCTGSCLVSIGFGSSLGVVFGKGLICSGWGFIGSAGFGGSGTTTGSGFFGCINSTVSCSGIFLIASNLKLGITAINNRCSKIEQTIAQISVLSLMLEFLIEMSKWILIKR